MWGLVRTTPGARSSLRRGRGDAVIARGPVLLGEGTETDGSLADFGDFLAAAFRQIFFPLAARKLLEVIHCRI